jgi:hypothetical protein
MNIPPDVLKILETEIDGISHGTVSLTIHIRDSRPRFVIGQERSFFPETDTQSVDKSLATIEKKKRSVSKNHVLRRGDVND